VILTLQPLTASDFAPFGQVFTPPPPGERTPLAPYFENLRSDAQIMCHISNRPPTALPCSVAVMERHRFSSQAFVALDVSRYIVTVAPGGADGLPDLARIRAFCVNGKQSINYRAGIWHCPLMVLDRHGQFTVVMWVDGTADDEEFVDLSERLEFRA
jgi:ureidoglycolate lyase